MIPLFTQTEFQQSKSNELLLLECEYCHNPFKKPKKDIMAANRPKSHVSCKTCSKKCLNLMRTTAVMVQCAHCSKSFQVEKNRYLKHPIHFCNKQCKGFHWNQNKDFGSSRSKLEHYLEIQLKTIYSDLDILFNNRSLIGYELDIYIPCLNIAFELNGILHYEPIYGIDRLNYTQGRDKSKSKICHDQKIDLCVIDTSQQKYFKPASSQKYLDLITNVIKQRLENSL